MVRKTRRIAASAFKASCLALLDVVASTGETIVVTKRGKPVARVVPFGKREDKSLKGSVLWQGDLISPIDIEWNYD